MLFNSIEYIFIFIPVVFIGYFLLNKIKLYQTAKVFLIIASLFFYGSYRTEYVGIIVLTILLNYAISKIFTKNIPLPSKKLILFSGIVANILILYSFRYFNFLAEFLSNFSICPLDTFKIVMPIGISFFMLQQISYIVDCYKETIKSYSLVDYTLFVCFFPQLIMGPIVRHQEMIPQFNDMKNKVINQNNIFIGLFIFTVGLLKKVVISDAFSPFITYVTNSQIFDNFYIVWLLGITKILQGYFDFSGYCDMAMGSAFLFNISLPWNFNSPYKATSILDYWKRWNKTLMRFLSDYVYKPLGGDKLGAKRTYLNVMIMFFVYGCWQGLTLTNIVYGLVNGILVCINKFWETLKIRIPKPISIAMTFVTLIFLSTLIMAENLQTTFTLLKSMLGINASFAPLQVMGLDFIVNVKDFTALTVSIPILILALVCVLFLKNSCELSRLYVKANNAFLTCILAIVFVFSVLSITKSTEFLYFIF